MMEYEDVLKRVGRFGPFQKRLMAMLFFAGIPNAFPSIMFAYTQYEPEFHCAPTPLTNISKDSSEYQKLLNETIPWETDSYGVKRRSRCEMYNSTTGPTGHNETTMIPCMYGVEFENMDTVIAEFGLVCENSWKSPLAVTLYMCGMALAAFCGYLSDRFGRRPTFLFFTFGQFIMTAAAASTWNYESYASSILVVGMVGIVNYVIAFVLATEMLGMKKRLEAAMICCIAYGIGYAISPLLGYLCPNWRWYLRSNALLGLLYLPLLRYFPESLRWLLVCKKEKEAKQLIARIRKENGRSVDNDDIYDAFQRSQKESEENVKNLLEEEKIDVADESSYFRMIRNPTMLVRCLVLYMSWFASSLLYFAISLNPSELNGDRLINIFLSGIVELPAFVLAYYFPHAIGRVRTMFGFMFLSGLCCVIAPFLRTVSPAAVTVLVLIGKCAVTGAFDVVYLISCEISPTLVRNTSLGVASVCARIGGIIMPYLMYTGGSQHHSVPFVVMGGIALLTGCLYLLFIPETKGVPMPDTVEKAVQNKRIYGMRICKTFDGEKQEPIEAKLGDEI